jgi:hypothetical protein
MALFGEGLVLALAVALIMLLILGVGPEFVGWLRKPSRKQPSSNMRSW